MAENKVRSSLKDYNTALEGVSYAKIICKNKYNNIEQQITTVTKGNLMQGATGEEYAKKLQTVNTVVSSALAKYESLARVIQEVCTKNGAFLNTSVMNDFEEAQKKFGQFSKRVEEFKGKK